jgi:hypothetical protein
MTPAIQNEGFVKYNTSVDKNYPYYIWSFTFNTTFLDIIDKCHNRNNDLKILCLPEIQPVLLKNYSEYLNDWSQTKVDIIYSGYGDYDKEKDFYNRQDFFRHLNPNRHFFTLYFLYHTFANYQNRFVTPPTLNYNPKYYFTSYNRLPRVHRMYILQLLKDFGLLETNLYSCFSTEFNIKQFNWFTRNHFDFTNFNVPTNYPDPADVVNQGNYWEIYPSYLESAFQQVTESTYDVIFLTEKTFIPILHRKPFITYGAKNVNKVLTNFGFKLYDEIFDYTFDSVDDDIIRAQEHVKEIKRVCEKYSPLEIREALKDTAEYNYNVALDILKNKKFIPDIFFQWEKEYRNEDVWRHHMSKWYYEFTNNLDNY